MSLQISYVERLEDVVAPAIEFLGRDRDLFAKPRIVVPTAGAKAWLWSELAGRLGATPGGPDGRRPTDGIVANVEFSYPGTILALLQPKWKPGFRDPWSFDALTFGVLDVITGPKAAQLGLPFDAPREPLLMARRIAGMFDEYHVRRPAMIARWQTGQEVLSPVATPSRSIGDDWAAETLATNDGWQFRVWRAVLEQIGSGGPLDRLGVENLQGREPLLVAGLQSLSLQQLESLEMIATVCDVEVLLVHPSPPLAARWRATLPQVSKDVPPPREPAELPEDLDPLVATWLHGARETQTLLASQGHRPEHRTVSRPAAPATVTSAPPSLLARMQRSIVTAEKPVKEPHEAAKDRSFVIHRCHGLSRQAEVLFDALLHAFHDHADLQPHDVVIVSPCLKELAPHLEAVFAREIVGADGKKTKLPLVIADRGLSEVSEAARLLVDLLGLVGSRCSVEQFRSVATHPLVQRHFHVDDDTIATWDHLIERTAIRWGLDARHRLREQFPQAAAEAHTWRAGLERMLLGATLPDGKPKLELGGTVPLDDVSLEAIEAIGPLVKIYEVVAALDDARHTPRAVAAWCGTIEEAIFGLCGTGPSELAEPLRAVRSLAAASSATPVPFADVRTILIEELESVVGRQPLRTGAITATSMVPLRDVPFRVVCVAGYDDGKVGGGEPKGDDLVARQSLAGDGDPRIDTRRALLDCLLAAGDRLVITCNGMNIKNNHPLPLVTPLAELVDFAVRHGVARPDPAKASAIEVTHPRHAVGRRNFEPGSVQQGITWSHDPAALAVAAAVERDEPRQVTRPGDPKELPVIELALLEDMVRDPLKLYLKKTLGMSTWRDDEEFPAATIPLALTRWEQESLARELLDLLLAGDGDEEQRLQGWLAAVRATDRVPFGPFGELILGELLQFANGIKNEAAAKNPALPLTGFESVPVRIQLPDRLLTGSLANVHRATNQLVYVRVGEGDKTARGMPIHIAALHLLVAQAAGIEPAIERALVVARHNDWQPGAEPPVMKDRKVTLANALHNPAAARQRLAEICDLLPQALAHPCGRFGEAAAAKARNLAGAVGSFNRTVGSPGYGRSGEAAVYGLSPNFDEVFAQDSPELAFHAAFERLFSISRTYVLS
jgi:exodeoxyribonuclease V gamma subunit